MLSTSAPIPLSISLEKQAPLTIAKASFPLRYGIYSEIRTGDFEFIFNLNGEIKFIRGAGAKWPHPAEQLKRTDGNDWVYYSVGDNSGDGSMSSSRTSRSPATFFSAMRFPQVPTYSSRMLV